MSCCNLVIVINPCNRTVNVLEPEGFKLVGCSFRFFVLVQSLGITFLLWLVLSKAMLFVPAFSWALRVISCCKFCFVVPLESGLPDLCVLHCLNRYYTSVGRPISAPFSFAWLTSASVLKRPCRTLLYPLLAVLWVCVELMTNPYDCVDPWRSAFCYSRVGQFAVASWCKTPSFAPTSLMFLYPCCFNDL
jgi:hypothetical protein